MLKGSNSFDLNNHWSRNAVVYQIYPLSFRDSNGDGKGDLAGIVEKIAYLQSLGVNAVWICPFYRSPMTDFGYDIEDYTDIDPVFGDLKIFERLVHELHKRDIKLIIDFVGNHTAMSHKWFVESRASRTNPKRDWYIWRDSAANGGPPNNWLSVFGGPAWEFDKNSGQYYLHTFLKEQPDLNWHNPEVRSAMMSVIDFWADKGVDGFRVDALQHFLEDEKLRDESPNPYYKKDTDEAYKSLVHRFSLGLNSDAPGTQRKNSRINIIGTFLNEIFEKHKDLFIVGEVYIGLDDLMKVYDLCPGGRFMPFNFNLLDLPWRALEYKKVIDEYQSKLSKSKSSRLANYCFGNHDVSRLASRVGEAKARLVAFLQHTLPGMPFIYYGDEIGMTNGAIPPHAIKDFLAKMFPGFHPGRDLERTPMQWDDSEKAGFTTSEPWLPISTNREVVNVKHESEDPHSILSLYKKLILLRKNLATLRIGEYISRQSTSPMVLSFERHYGNEQLLVLINFSDSIEREILPSHGPHDKETKIIFSTGTHSPLYQNSKFIELLPYEGCIIKL